MKKCTFILNLFRCYHARLAFGISVGSVPGSHAYAHCVIAIPRLAAGATDSVFPRSLRSGFYKTPRLRRSEFAHLIHGVLQIPLNNHYLTLTRFTPRILKFLKGNVKNVLVKKKELPLQA